MLHELRITGLGVIDELDLEFHPGLNVLTGETGAGKTMITVGLSLALGARGNASLVRDGANAARIQARFDAPAGTEEWAEDDELLLSRTIAADGKGRYRIGGQLATASALTDLGAGLVEVHGQHQTQQLLQPATHATFLDRFAGERHLAERESYREVFDELEAVRRQIEALTTAARDRERARDLLAYQVHEIESAAPLPQESERLAVEEARLAHVERLLEQTGSAESALADEGGVADALGPVTRSLEAAAELDPSVGELASRVHALSVDAGELARDVRGYRESLQADPEHLQAVRERVGQLRGLQRKYGDTETDVLGFLDRARTDLQVLEHDGEHIAELEERRIDLARRAQDLATNVSDGRLVAAPRLAEALRSELEELGMAGAQIEVAMEPLPELTAAGGERVELRFAAAPGASLRPLAKTASGGELSRTMLACRSVLADLDEVPTLVFDEVDAGIGGEAGLAVGRRLARLARDRQVLVVTHLPQIAGFADRHVSVSKERGTAAIRVLGDDERVAELSRMLAGLSGSRSAVSHAEELLTSAAEMKTGA